MRSKKLIQLTVLSLPKNLCRDIAPTDTYIIGFLAFGEGEFETALAKLKIIF